MMGPDEGSNWGTRVLGFAWQPKFGLYLKCNRKILSSLSWCTLNFLMTV